VALKIYQPCLVSEFIGVLLTEKKNGKAVKFLKTPRFVLNNHLLILQFPKEANGGGDRIQHTLSFRGEF
jgi:hypothetical protein